MSLAEDISHWESAAVSVHSNRGVANRPATSPPGRGPANNSDGGLLNAWPMTRQHPILGIDSRLNFL